MPSPLQTVLNILPKLDGGDIQRVALKIKALQGLKGSAAKEPIPRIRLSSTPSAADPLLMGVYKELRHRGLVRSNFTVPDKLIAGAYSAVIPPIWEDLCKRAKVTTSQDRTALAVISVRSLALYLEQVGVPISVGTLINNMSKIPQALDRQFPGYLRAGLLNVVLKSIDANKGD